MFVDPHTIANSDYQASNRALQVAPWITPSNNPVLTPLKTCSCADCDWRRKKQPPHTANTGLKSGFFETNRRQMSCIGVHWAAERNNRPLSGGFHTGRPPGGGTKLTTLTVLNSDAKAPVTANFGA